MQLGERTKTTRDRVDAVTSLIADPIRTARRSEVRGLLVPLMIRDGLALEQFDMGESGIQRIGIGDPELIRPYLGLSDLDCRQALPWGRRRRGDRCTTG